MFRDFLHTAKVSERLVERKRYGEEVTPKQLADSVSRVWLAHQVMDAFCPQTLVQLAEDYIHTFWAEYNLDAPGEVVGQLMTPARQRLIKEARQTFSEYGERRR